MKASRKISTAKWVMWGMVVLLVACRPLDVPMTPTDTLPATDTAIPPTEPPTETPLIPTATLEPPTPVPPSPTSVPVERLVFSAWNDLDAQLAKINFALVNGDGSGFEPLDFFGTVRAIIY